MDDRFNSIYTESYEEYGGNGERVLGFAMKYMDVSFEEETRKDPKYKDKLRIDMIGKPTDTTTPITDLIFVGLVKMIMMLSMTMVMMMLSMTIVMINMTMVIINMTMVMISMMLIMSMVIMVIMIMIN